MTGKGTFHVEVENDLRGWAILLKSVVCEWLLIFFLLVDAVYLYFLKKFARYCNLQLPCILCSRLDHIFGNEKPDFYKDLICNDHRSKLSSLVYCHSHGSLADVHDVCEECLLSFATKKDSSPEIYKFLIGKLGLDGLRNPASDMDFFHGFVSVKSCSCCNKQWRCRPIVQKLVKTQSFGSRAPKPNNIPLPTPQQKPYDHRDAVAKARDRVSVSPAATPPVSGYPDSDPMAQVGYSKLKIPSHSESDFMFSEDDGGREHREYDKLDRADHQGPGYSFKKQFEECFTTKKVISPTKIPSDVPRPQTQQPKFSLSQPEVASKPVKEGQDSKEGPSVGQRFSSSRVSTQPPSPSKPSLDKDDDKADGDVETWEAFDLITPKVGERDDEDKKDGVSITGFHTGYSQTSKHPNAVDSLGKASGLHPDRNEISQRTQVSSSDDKADLPFRFKVNGYVDEPYNPSTADSLGKASGDRNEISKRTQVSSSDDKADLPFRFKVNGYVDEPYKDIKVSQNPTSLEMSDSNLSLSELSVVDKIGEDQKLISQLRKQIEEDKECIERLREELDEERSASAEAANQAMAMITKLQEEKAVLNMDAQQYLRMMEEQAEHDVEALDRANDLLTEKEKEIQDLEAELDFYRMNHPDEYEEQFAQFAS